MESRCQGPLLSVSFGREPRARHVLSKRGALQNRPFTLSLEGRGDMFCMKQLRTSPSPQPSPLRERGLSKVSRDGNDGEGLVGGAGAVGVLAVALDPAL